ncbi:isoaspartyl peptidase/L-asparaginase family protein [Pseudomarimonas arenosa]|uniref:Isoaspartyl peptidase n=1 Tax=Pseudomarimonas arenosa TaxID=2774145 RepID=A0AAW3ZPW3_9GAMM|nr:isoaspartyl peptidase/L-asparaginase [Pseudomarimonas arenosa]MBD8526975.1 isoaspartyl peptidase/L-asparaginase [Pseudomarimonas arenosa]
MLIPLFRRQVLSCCLFGAIGCALQAQAAQPASPNSYAIALHGGAGTISREQLSAAQEAAIRADLNVALDAAETILAQAGSALDAAEAAVVILEDSPYFNAGKGAVFNADGVNELDASIMDGATRKAGAVAALHRVKNPIRAARAVMDKSVHVMLIGDGAEAFARSTGIEMVDPDYFHTEFRWQQLQDAKRAQAAQSTATDAYFGTVGAVVLDQHGHLAAATSTGGMTNKRYGRVGDSPIIGAGTWADDRCAVSATGWGEFYIRLGVAQDICARLRYRGDSLQTAAEHVVMQDIPAAGGDGGVIAIDHQGNIALPFNTKGMYRAWLTRDGERGVAVFQEP